MLNLTKQREKKKNLLEIDLNALNDLKTPTLLLTHCTYLYMLFIHCSYYIAIYVKAENVVILSNKR